MKCSIKTLLPAALLTLGLSIGHGFAGEHQPGAIAWSGVDVHAGTNETACVAGATDDLAVAAAIHMAPSPTDFGVDATPLQAVLVTKPYELPSEAASMGAGRPCTPLTLVTRTQ
jgi:hypothetical protein